MYRCLIMILLFPDVTMTWYISIWMRYYILQDIDKQSHWCQHRNSGHKSNITKYIFQLDVYSIAQETSAGGPYTNQDVRSGLCGGSHSHVTLKGLTLIGRLSFSRMMLS